MSKRAYVVIQWVGLLILAFAALYLVRTHSNGQLHVTTVDPANGVPDAVAISPDGNSVAMMYYNVTVSGDAIEVHDIRSGRVASLLLPIWKDAGYPVLPWSKYCDGGKYLLASNGMNLAVIETHSLQLHTSIELFGGKHVLDCSAESGVAVIADSSSEGASYLWAVDLESGTESADLSVSLKGRYQGDGIAISPNGTQLALATWRFGASQGSTLELISIPEKKSIGTFALPKSIRVPKHQLSFAGEHAVMVGEEGCDDKSETCLPYVGRAFQVIDLNNAGGAAQVLAQPGMEAYRFSGGSADGVVVFGYTGAESRCTSCNGTGETKISDARFTVWDRNSGRVIARSPSLHVQVHSCWLNIGLASCTSYQRPPELQMSANGKAILAFSPPLDYSQAKPGDAKVEVFYRR
jgi:WD40 repeat protein